MAGNLETLELRPHASELPRMRRFVRRCARRYGLDDEQRFRAAVVATEAVSNAIRHGFREGGEDRPITVTCRHDPRAGLTVEVGDRGSFKPSPPQPFDGIGGRGLHLIERLSSRFELETSREGTKLRMLVAQDQEAA